MEHPDAIYSREEISPDGLLRICYNYSDGEKTPTVIEPCVSIATTGEVLFDLWRTSTIGLVDDFSPTGFRLIVSDNYNQTKILVRVELPAKTFTVIGDPTPPRRLAGLEEVLLNRIDHDRQKRAALTSPPPSRPRPIGRLIGWFTGNDGGA